MTVIKKNAKKQKKQKNKRKSNSNRYTQKTKSAVANIDRERFIQCMLARINETVGEENEMIEFRRKRSCHWLTMNCLLQDFRCATSRFFLSSEIYTILTIEYKRIYVS